MSKPARAVNRRARLPISAEAWADAVQAAADVVEARSSKLEARS